MTDRACDLAKKHAPRSQTAVKRALGLNQAEWRAVQEAADDAHMHPVAYAKLMLLCAAGCGGVIEHAERAVAASWDAEAAAQ